ncbi:MAG: DNA cytosine methyltransferase [Ignisphaera sp.]|uniref:DNA (cytosine-5-)-methyltransferase n=1 Tax=Ignisphaera aggregans TaxID=334771 RepID=A0A7J3MZQ1_9CREN
MKYTVVDLFSGSGGFSIGFRDTGFKIAMAIDSDPSCGKTYKFNFPSTIVLVEDIKDIDGKDIAYFISRKPDIVIGSPPCEPFTGANPKREKDPLDRLYKDPQGTLVLDFIRLVGELKPRIFVMENVPALNTSEIRESIVKEFSYIGYSQIFFNLLRAEDYGTPSRRTRLFVSNVVLKPKPTGKKVLVRDVLDDISCETDLPNNSCLYPTDRKLKRMARIVWGKALFYYQGALKRIPNYIRLDPNDLAPTVLGSSRFLHPYENRLLTVREQARLMGFPDNHVFFGDRDQQYNQVGEAVPPPLSYSIALYVRENYT